MRVLIASSVSPFSGREEIHWTQAIADALRKKRMDVDTFMLPIVSNPLLIPEQMMSMRLLNIESSCELLLTIGYPAFVLKHRRKRVLLFSLASSLHEHFGTDYGVLSTPQYQRIRDAVHAAEKRCLIEAEGILCASHTLAVQIQNEYNVMAKTLIFDDNTLDDTGDARLPEDGSWVVCESTLEPSDRIDLLLNAMLHAKQQWRLHISVPSASGVYQQALHQRIERSGLKERVLVSDTVLSPGALKKARAFIALHFATTRIPERLLRAIKFRIPVITTTDCGAILEIARHERNGLVVEPSAQAIAQALDLIVADEKLHKRLAHGTRRSIGGISNVDKLVESLVEQ